MALGDSSVNSIGDNQVVSPIRSPNKYGGIANSPRQIPSINMLSAKPMSPMSQHEWEETSSEISKITTPLVDIETERMLDSMRKQMHEPNKQMADLLTAIHSPLEGSGVTMNRGYMTRRKNACGALKVMAAKSAARMKICWTQGALASLTTVLTDSGNGNLEEEYPDFLTRLAYIEARKRAVATLLYLASSRRNRLLVFHSPGLLRALAKVMHEDEGECRQGCSTIITYLAKTNENRLLMAQVESVIDAATLIITPKAVSDEEQSKTKVGTEEGSNTEQRNDVGDADKTEADEGEKSQRKCDTDKEGEDTRKANASSTTIELNKISEYDKDPNHFLHGS
eukprot:9431121-Ditylum_brightwellii.AAC.1